MRVVMASGRAQVTRTLELGRTSMSRQRPAKATVFGRHFMPALLALGGPRGQATGVGLRRCRRPSVESEMRPAVTYGAAAARSTNALFVGGRVAKHSALSALAMRGRRGKVAATTPTI